MQRYRVHIQSFLEVSTVQWKGVAVFRRLSVLIVAMVGVSATSAQECTVPVDCNDYNVCTADSCQAGVCVHTPGEPGVACGLQLNSDCTDPDTCDPLGRCRHNDLPDGTACTHPIRGPGLCTAGLCAPLSFSPTALPEGGNVGSEPRDIHLSLLGTPTLAHIAGRVMAPGGESIGAVWESHDPLVACITCIALLPTPPNQSSEANAIAASSCSGGTQTYLTVGRTLDQPQPGAWTCDVTGCDTTNPQMTPWVAEVPPLPVGAVGGVIADNAWLFDQFTAVGYSYDGLDRLRAALWERSPAGAWTHIPLPDNGPGLNAEALAVDIGPGTSPIAGRRVVVGGVESIGIAHIPSVWVETAVDSGVFDLYTMPLFEGLASGHLTGTMLDPLGLPRYALCWFTGQGSLHDGTDRGLVYRTPDFTTWEQLVLPPLPDYENSKATGFSSPTDATPDLIVATGVSYNTDPLTDGVATNWRIRASTFELERSVNLNNLVIVGSPGSSRLVTLFAAEPDDEGAGLRAGVMVNDSPGNKAVAGTPLPHAFDFRGVEPAPIPAVSTWGLIAFAILVLAAGTLTMRRRASLVA